VAFFKALAAQGKPAITASPLLAAVLHPVSGRMSGFTDDPLCLQDDATPKGGEAAIPELGRKHGFFRH